MPCRSEQEITLSRNIEVHLTRKHWATSPHLTFSNKPRSPPRQKRWHSWLAHVHVERPFAGKQGQYKLDFRFFYPSQTQNAHGNSLLESYMRNPQNEVLTTFTQMMEKKRTPFQHRSPKYPGRVLMHGRVAARVHRPLPHHLEIHIPSSLESMAPSNKGCFHTPPRPARVCRQHLSESCQIFQNTFFL